MSSQKGNVSRSRAQKHQNAFAYKNNKYGATSQVKVANSKIHEGLCLHCKGVLEWKVKYNKYKSLTQPRKCVKCSEKTVKDAYHILCKPCSLQLEICCKCGKKEDIVVPINSDLDKEEPEEDGEQTEKGSERGKKDRDSDDDDDFDEDLDDKDDEDFDSDLNQKKTQKGSAALPDVSRVHFKE
ncbi:uncharacterized protein C9orf85 homolog [Hippoglossus stenolepis]|uniref:uncharacterized protein C9orf85 homolog n=1 Tax=Hippoglossus stenolepis TaxID=195615 RepID=UPI001FAEE33C|nr:uncharacterized protein C9orf85 homolog [Hippoglossus stenolepis]